MHNVDTLESFKTKLAVLQLPQYSFEKLVVIWNGYVFEATPKLWSTSENERKTISMKQLWTTFADRRRAGPPAFRRKYRQKPIATLSLLLGGRLFLRDFYHSRRG